MLKISQQFTKHYFSVSLPIVESKVHKFQLGEFPNALQYERPFRTFYIYQRIDEVI